MKPKHISKAEKKFRKRKKVFKNDKAVPKCKRISKPENISKMQKYFRKRKNVFKTDKAFPKTRKHLQSGKEFLKQATGTPIVFRTVLPFLISTSL